MLTNGMIQSNNNDENNKDDDEMCFYMSKRKKRLTMTSCQDRDLNQVSNCLLYTSPSPRDKRQSRMPSSA